MAGEHVAGEYVSQLAPLLAGLAIFLVGHIAPRLGGLRERLIGRMGKGAYQASHGIVSLVGLALIIYGYAAYRAGGYIPLWSVPRFFNHIAILLVWPAMILAAASVLPGAIQRNAKYPMLAAVKLWALVHLIVNGDLGSLLLFGSLLGWAVFTRIQLKRTGGPERMPGATRLAPSRRNDIAAVIIGTLVAGAMVMGLHKILFGVAIL